MRAWIRGFVLFALMLAASAGAVALRPTHMMADDGPRLHLAKLFPEKFGDWTLASGVRPIAVSPDVQQKLDELYDQILDRTYVDSKGHVIMLSVAYGGDQSSDKTQVHRPEFCYAAQGFSLSDIVEGQISTGDGRLPVRRLIAVQGERIEPITYWIVIGNNVTLPGLGRKILQLRYGITGKVADGMLVRVSSIDPDRARAYDVQERFIVDLLAATDAQDRVRIAGHPIN